MTLRAFLYCLFLWLPIQQAEASEWLIDKATSQLTFEATQTGTNFTGHFTDFTADVFFDPAHPETGTITATIWLASVDAGDKQRNTALPATEWFATEKFPTAVFTSEKITATGPNLFQAKGTLTLKEAKQPVTLDFSFEEESGKAHIKATTSLNRSHFGVGTGPWAVGKWVALDVDIHITLNATRKRR
ncbi:MAG: YceI family protein [Kordiimonadaceae bacterium]|nr:YceI family protein [Kordiimonadaceae bacterium]